MISYAYDETGLRTEKSTNTNRTYFDRDASGNLVHEFRDYSGYLGEDSITTMLMAASVLSATTE